MKNFAKTLKKALNLMLTAALALGLCIPAGGEAYAQDKVDIGSDPNIGYLTSYVYPENGGVAGEIRLVDLRDNHILTAGTDISFSAAADGSGSYDLTVTALESSDKYTGSFTCKPDLIGTGAAKSRNSTRAGNWKYLPYDSFEGWTGYAVIGYTAGSTGKANLVSLNDFLEDQNTNQGSVDIVLPGSVYGQSTLKEALLGDIDYEPYIFVNCPNLASISLLSDEFTAPSGNERDIKPIHLGPISAVNTTVDGENVNKIKLIVNRKAKWTDDDDKTVLTMEQFCTRKYSDFYIMEVNARDFYYGNWFIRASLDSYGDPEEFTIISYKPKNEAARNVTSITLPDTIVYDVDDEEYSLSDGDADFSLETNVFSDLPNLKEIRTGKYLLTAPLANECPKLQKIVSDLTADDVDDELGVWQEDSENLKYMKDLQPLVNGDIEGSLELVISDDFAWLMDEPLTNAQGQYITPDGQVTEDPDEADYTEFRLSQYCAKFGYAFSGISMQDARFRINAHNSMTAIAGNNSGGRDLALSLWLSYDPSGWEDDECDWYPAAGMLSFSLSDWSLEAVEGNESMLGMVTLDAADGSISVDPALSGSGSVKVSCKVTDNDSGDVFIVSSVIDVVPRFETDIAEGRYLYIDDEGNTKPEVGRVIPFFLNAYASDEASNAYAGRAGDEYCDYYRYSPFLNYNGGDVPQIEAFHQQNGVTGTISLADYNENKAAADIAELVPAYDGEPLYLIKAKEGASEQDRFIVNAAFAYHGDSYDLSNEMIVTKGYKLSDEDRAAIPEEGILTVGTFEESYSSALAYVIAGMYPEFIGRVQVFEMDEDEWTDKGKAYADYMSGTEDCLFDESEPEYNPDIIIWPAYMLKDQQGSPASAAFGDLGITLNGDAYSRYGAMARYESKDGKEYAVTTSLNPGGFVYNKAVAKAVLGTDDPAEVQRYLSSWEGFVDVMELIRSGEEHDGDSLRVKVSDEKDYYMLSSADRLADAVIQGRSVLTDDGIALGGSVLDYLVIRQKLKDAGAIGEETDLMSGEAFGRFATEMDTLDRLTLSAGLINGTLDIVRGPSSYAGEGTELATVTGVRGNAMSSFAEVFLKHMLTDTTAMNLAYEGGEDSSGSRFSNNINWQASLDESALEGTGVRTKWNRVIEGMNVPESDVITEFVTDYTEDKWDTDLDTSLDLIYNGLRIGTLLPVVKPISEDDTGSWRKKQYAVDRSHDSDCISKFDMRAPHEDPQTGAADAAEKDRFDRSVAASVVSEDGTETYFYSLTRAIEASEEAGGATIRLYKNMTYSDCPFDINKLPLDLNGKTITTPQGTLPVKPEEPASQGQSVSAPAAPVEIIDLPAVKITKPKAAKKKLTVKWKKVKKKNLKKISGIQIQVATDPNFTNIVKTANAGKKKTSKKIGGLQAKTKYYVRIRAYGAANHYSVWKGKTGKTK